MVFDAPQPLLAVPRPSPLISHLDTLPTQPLSIMYNSHTRLCVSSAQTLSQMSDDCAPSVSSINPKVESEENTVHTHHGSRHSLSLRTLAMEWKWEIFNWIVGTIACVAIFSLLLRFGNRPVNHWPFSKFPISSVIVAFSQVAFATLMGAISPCIGQWKWIWFQRSHMAADLERFDEASRGFSGSLVLLWKSLWHGYYQ